MDRPDIDHIRYQIDSYDSLMEQLGDLSDYVEELEGTISQLEEDNRSCDEIIKELLSKIANYKML